MHNKPTLKALRNIVGAKSCQKHLRSGDCDAARATLGISLPMTNTTSTATTATSLATTTTTTVSSPKITACAGCLSQ
jgi:hypothetical protein